MRITQGMVQEPRARWVDIDAINYATKYTAKMKAKFSSVTKSSLMNLYLNQEHQNRSISLTINC